MNMNRRRKIEIGTAVAVIGIAAVLLIGYAALLRTQSYPTHFIIGLGRLPDVRFGLYTENGTEVADFNFAGLMPQSVTTFTYTLRQKSNYNLNVYMRWGYTILPVSWLNLEMKFNGAQWLYTDYAIWNTTQEIPISFVVTIGDMDNMNWDSELVDRKSVV
jgi:hypothetical protein